MYKKVVILGHTSGIGLSLSQSFKRKDYEVIGLSKSTGHNIESDYDSILAITKDADVFINNAYAGFYNVHLLYDLFELWQNQDKVIVNISSDSSDGIKDYPHLYAVAKGAIDKASIQLQNCDGRCRVINIRPGYVDTPRVEKINAEKMSADDVTRIILWAIDQPSHIYLREISFRARPRIR